MEQGGILLDKVTEREGIKQYKITAFDTDSR